MDSSYKQIRSTEEPNMTQILFLETIKEKDQRIDELHTNYKKLYKDNRMLYERFIRNINELKASNRLIASLENKLNLGNQPKNKNTFNICIFL